MRIRFQRFIIFGALVLGMALSPKSALASDQALRLYSGGNDPDGLAANQPTDNVFYDHSFTYSYSGGAICLSSKSDTCASPAIDDAVGIFIDDTQVFYQESNTHDFGPVDFSGKLHKGTNRIRVQLIDLMGPSRGGSALWLVPSEGGNDCIPDCGTGGELLGPGSGLAANPCPPIGFEWTGALPVELPQIEWPGPQPVELLSGYVEVHESPSLSSKAVAQAGPGMRCTVDKYVLNEGYIWTHVIIPQGIIFGGQTTIPNGGQGWVAFEDNSQGGSAQPALPSPSAESTTETWSTSVNQCGVNPLIYEFYKDQNNQLKLVHAQASGFLEAVSNFFEWVGFIVDSSKVKFEPTADEVKVTLLYSNTEKYKAQVDRYLGGKLLSSDEFTLDAATYQQYLGNLTCGITT